MTHETFTYGKFIAKMKTDDKRGTCSSFFTFWKGTDEEPWHTGGWSQITLDLAPSEPQGTYNASITWEDQ